MLPECLLCREEEAEDISPASLVLSIQILGYDGGEVDSSEPVTMTFPINVRPCSPLPHKCMYVADCWECSTTAHGPWAYIALHVTVVE